MEQKKDLAIVLRSVPYEERHRIVTALTEHHGRVSALARNSIQSRRFGGTLEPFAASEWRFVERPGADLFRVEEASIRRSFDGLRKDFERLSLASAFNELMLRLAPEREPCPDLFRLHSNALVSLEEEEAPSLKFYFVLLNAYLGKILQWNGTPPQLWSCMECGRELDSSSTEKVLCLVDRPGWLCDGCAPRSSRAAGTSFSSFTLQKAAIRDFNSCLGIPIRQATQCAQAEEEELKTLVKYLEALLAYHVPGFDKAPIASLRFLGL